jgi:hypothetical protein
LKYAKLIFILLVLCALSCSKKATEPYLAAEAPVFSPVGGVYNIGQAVSISCASEEAEIRYTLDGTDPTVESTLYISPFVLPTIFINNSNYVTIKAKAFQANYNPSQTVTETYSVNFVNTVQKPEIEQAEGTFTHTFSVAVTCDTPGAEIRYTTDGSEPDYMSQLYTAPVGVYNQETTLKARAFKSTWNASGTISKTYTLLNYQAGMYDATDVSISDVIISGNYAYLACGHSGLRIIDISNPEAPVLAGSIGTSDATDVTVSGSYAYVADYSDGLKIIDISNPSSPILKGSIAISSDAMKVIVSGNYAYVGTPFSGLRVIDVSNPDIPFEAGSLESVSANWSSDIKVKGDFLYLTIGGIYYSNMYIINVSNPRNPILTYTYSLGYEAIYGLAINGNYAYLACDEAGLKILDISNPANPITAGEFDTPGSASDVEISGNLACIADEYWGLRIIDIRYPAYPVETGYVVTPSANYNYLALKDGYAYVLDYDKGMRVIKINNL